MTFVNGLLLPMVATDQALLEALEQELLHPAVMARTIEKAISELERGDEGPSARVEALLRELATTETQMGRVTRSIVLGGPL